MQEILVSINCTAYNQELYIRDAIEGFLNQKTTFHFEILIHDDASTDNTANIIREYEKKHPDIIKPIYQTENQYSKKWGIVHRIQQERAKGKYMASCEGDDYWTDPYKLQKQVDFMEANPECSLCFHATKHVQANNPEDFFINRPKEIPPNNIFGIKHVIQNGGGFMSTCSMVYLKKYSMNRPDWMDRAPVGDLPSMLLLATKGKIGYIDDVMSVYRLMSLNSWTSKMQEPEKRKEHHFGMLKMWDDFDAWTHKKYHWQITKRKLKKRWYYNKGLLKKYLDKTLLLKK